MGSGLNMSQPLESTPYWIRIDTTGEITSGDKKPELELLHLMVGGYIEAAPTELGITAFVDEEGKLKGKPFNPWATVICSDIIAGPMVVTGPADRAGEITHLPPYYFAMILFVLAPLGARMVT